MSEYQATNGTWVIRNGGMLGFGPTREAAGKRAGYGSGGRVTDIFLSPAEWEALEEFMKQPPA